MCEDCLPVWIDYYLKQGDFYLSLVKIARGVATKRVQPKELLELKIPLPSIEVQKEVVEHFKSIETEDDELKIPLLWRGSPQGWGGLLSKSTRRASRSNDTQKTTTAYPTIQN